MSTTVVSKQPTAVNPRPVIKKKKKTAEQQTGSFNKEKIGKKWRTRESINEGQWDHDLSDFLMDCENIFMAACFPCLFDLSITKDITKSVGKGVLACVFSPFGLIFTRKYVREIRKIEGSVVNDVFASLCCPVCARIQLKREVLDQDHGLVSSIKKPARRELNMQNDGARRMRLQDVVAANNAAARNLNNSSLVRKELEPSISSSVPRRLTMKEAVAANAAIMKMNMSNIKVQPRIDETANENESA